MPPVNPLGEFVFWCQKVLPLVFEESLSYYEVLCKLGYKIQEVIEYLDTLQIVSKDDLDKAIANLKIYVDNQDANYYNQVIATIDNEVGKLEQEIKDLQVYLLKEIDNVQKSLNSKIDANDNKQSINLELLRQEMYKLISQFNVECINPTNGKLEPLCKVINDIYEFLRYDGITAIEFDTRGITAQEFDNLDMTAKDFDLYSKKIIGLNLCECNVRNPFTGMLSPLQDVIDLLFVNTQNGIDANAFDALTITCQSFDDKSLSAYQFDSDSKNLLA